MPSLSRTVAGRIVSRRSYGKNLLFLLLECPLATRPTDAEVASAFIATPNAEMDAPEVNAAEPRKLDVVSDCWYAHVTIKKPKQAPPVPSCSVNAPAVSSATPTDAVAPLRSSSLVSSSEATATSAPSAATTIDVKALTAALRVGDDVRVTGVAEVDPVITFAVFAHTVDIVARWVDTNPRVAFESGNHTQLLQLKKIEKQKKEATTAPVVAALSLLPSAQASTASGNQSTSALANDSKLDSQPSDEDAMMREGTSAVKTPCKWLLSTGHCLAGDACRFWHPAKDELQQVRKTMMAASRAAREEKLRQCGAASRDVGSGKRTRDEGASIDGLKQRVREGSNQKTDGAADDNEDDSSQDENDAAAASHEQNENANGHNGNSDAHGFQRHEERAAVLAQFLIDTFGKEFLSQGSGVLDVAGGRGDIALELVLNGVPCTLVEPRYRKLSKQQRRRVAAAGLTMPPFQHLVQCMTPDLTGDDKALVQRSSLLVGLHPDEATEPIVDAAIAFGKPFVIVPCCVFGRLFPDRRLGRGTPEERPVRSYEEFLEYLEGKTGGVRRFQLALEGKNTLLTNGAPVPVHDA